MKASELAPEAPARFPYEQTGGYRAGLFNASWPFASLEVTPAQLTLRGFTSRYVFPHQCVTNLLVYRGLFSRGICIEHTIPEYPSAIVFWSFKLSELQERLREAGFPVSSQVA